MKLLKHGLFLASILLASEAVAVEGNGLEGRDFATSAFNLVSDIATITGICQTITEHNGNSVTARLYINKVKVLEQRVDMETIQVQYKVTTKGPHEVLLQCDNRYARAFSASLSVAGSDIPDI